MLDLMKRGGVVAGLGTAITMAMFLVSGAASAQTDPYNPADEVVSGVGEATGSIAVMGAAIIALVLGSALFFFAVKWLRKGINKG